MEARRYLIVNADDFGQSPGVNRGIIRAHEDGIVTSASLMVRWPAAAEAAAYAREHPALSVGLHLDLGEWSYCNGEWCCLYQVVPIDDAAAVRRETEQQLQTFRRLLGHGPSHLDSHQHVHRDEPLDAILQEVARKLGVPVRHFCPTVRYCGSFYGQTGKGDPFPAAISVDGMGALLASLDAGITELGCHPGEEQDVASMYCCERADEVRTLCDPRVQATLSALGIALCSFHSLPGRAARTSSAG